MLFAYVTTDEVNEDMAVQMAEECGVILSSRPNVDTPPSERFDAVLYDWDTLPLRRREEILTESLVGPSTRVVAVHGYSLDEDEQDAFHQDGVAVFHHLEPDVFRTLRHLARQNGRVARNTLARRHALSTHGRRAAACR